MPGKRLPDRRPTSIPGCDAIRAKLAGRNPVMVAMPAVTRAPAEAAQAPTAARTVAVLAAARAVQPAQAAVVVLVLAVVPAAAAVVVRAAAVVAAAVDDNVERRK